MGAVDHQPPFRHFCNAVDKCYAARSKSIYHMTVMHDLVEDENRRTLNLQDLVDHVDRHVHAGTKTTRICKQNFH